MCSKQFWAPRVERLVLIVLLVRYESAILWLTKYRKVPYNWHATQDIASVVYVAHMSCNIYTLNVLSTEQHNIAYVSKH